jgi:hypothetical protein
VFKILEIFEKMMSAVTFAERGEYNTAMQILEPNAEVMAGEATEEQEIPSSNKKILVLGDEYLFPKQIIDYAVDMAKRFGYDIVALNALPYDHRSRFLDNFHGRVNDSFVEHAERAVMPFAIRAQEEGIVFYHHVEKLGEKEALRKMHKSHPEIEFVITTPPHTDGLSAEYFGELNPVCVCSFCER